MNELKNNLVYFQPTLQYYQFVILKEIHNKKSISLPLEIYTKSFQTALSQISIQKLIYEGLVEKIGDKSNPAIRLTPKGIKQYQKHMIDYQLDLIQLEQNINEFYKKIVSKLKRESFNNIALYGASDTTLSIFKHLKDAGFKTRCIIDDNPNKQKEKLFDLDIIGINDLNKYDVEAVIISTIEYQDVLYDKCLKTLNNKKYKVIKLF